jgi:hypothetical protein
MSAETKKRKTSAPADGYLCSICGVAGHWIQQCPEKAKSKRKKSNHVAVPGVDPSQQDIDVARQLQNIKPPNCFCGQPSRLKKVKRSNVQEDSRAVGKYFFFCALKKIDNPCRFARPVEEEIKDKKERLCTFFAKNGHCKKGDKCKFSHELPDNFERKLQPKQKKHEQEEQQQGVQDTLNEQEEKKASEAANTENDSSSVDTDSNSGSGSDISSDDSDSDSSSNRREKKAVPSEKPAAVSDGSDGSSSSK